MLSMDLPSFLWLWRIAAWSMGLSLTVYTLLAITGGGLWVSRTVEGRERPEWLRPPPSYFGRWVTAARFVAPVHWDCRYVGRIWTIRSFLAFTGGFNSRQFGWPIRLERLSN